MKNRNIGISELLQSGQLITLLTIAIGIGKIWARIESKLDDHGARIQKMERIISPAVIVRIGENR